MTADRTPVRPCSGQARRRPVARRAHGRQRRVPRSRPIRLRYCRCPQAGLQRHCLTARPAGDGATPAAVGLIVTAPAHAHTHTARALIRTVATMLPEEAVPPQAPPSATPAAMPRGPRRNPGHARPVPSATRRKPPGGLDARARQLPWHGRPPSRGRDRQRQTRSKLLRDSPAAGMQIAPPGPQIDRTEAVAMW